MFKKYRFLKQILFALCACCAVVGRSNAQNLVIGNPAEEMDFKSAFVNPAVISFHDKYVAVGGKVFHLGFVEGETSPFRQGLVSLILPFGLNSQTGFGIQGQYFNTPLFSQSNISFVLSRRFRHNYSFGLKFNIFSKSFNRANFDLVDQDDPVFRNGTSQWAATFGAGFFMFPWPNLSVGIGIDHINRADISLNSDNVYQPMAGYIGAVVHVGLLRASFSTTYEEGRFLPKTSIGTGMSDLGYFNVGFNANAFEAEGQLRITGPLSLNYSYEYTLFDSEGFGQGSHQVTLIHRFGQQRDLPKFEIPPQLLLSFQPPDKSYISESKFYVLPTVEKLEIIEKKLTRKIDTDVDPKALAQLSAFDLGILDAGQEEKALPFEKRPVDIARIPEVEDANLSENYQSFIKQVAEKLDGETDLQANIVTPKKSYMRAAGLKKYFLNDTLSAVNLRFVEPVYTSYEDSLLAETKIGTRGIRRREALTALSAASTTFQIIPVSPALRAVSWQLIIQNSHKLAVKTFSGSGSPDAEVNWDWRDQKGELVQPGVYACYLEWQDEQGNYHQTEERFLTVQKIIRHITIEISHKHKDIGEDADEINIILNK